MSRALVAARWELMKLSAQWKARLAVLVLVLGPFAVAILFGIQDGLPKDTLFGRHVHESAAALPLVLLGFAGTWALPLLTSVVAGDIFSSEDAHGTWKTVLTRSVSRSDVFLGKVIAAVLATVLLLTVAATSSIIAGRVLAGSGPLIGLAGQTIPPTHSLLLVIASWMSVLPPVLGFTALGCLLSAVSRSSVVGVAGPVVIGLLMTLLSLVDGIAPVRHVLLTSAFFSWYGLLQPHPYYGPLLQGAGISAAYIAVCLPLAARALLRRDIAVG